MCECIRKFQLTVTNDPQYVQITPGTDLGVFWASVWFTVTIVSPSLALNFNAFFQILDSCLPEELCDRLHVPGVDHILFPSIQQDAVSKQTLVNSPYILWMYTYL